MLIWLLWKLLTLPVRLVFGTLGLSFRTVRFIGFGRIIAFGAGVGAGLAIAPTPGTEFRARLASRSVGEAPDGGGLALADKVRDELAHAPRTWHLPQPGVTVEGRRITLTGEAPHEQARADLGRTAGTVAGVVAVDNRITVSAPPPTGA